jgi:hypothetical protein
MKAPLQHNGKQKDALSRQAGIYLEYQKKMDVEGRLSWSSPWL